MIRSKVLLWGFIAFYVAFFFFLSFRKFVSFDYHDFDLANHAQSVWNILHGSLDCSILGVPFLGNHFVPILFLIAPLYALFPSPLTLLFLQTLLLGGGAYFVYRLAIRLLDPRFALTSSLVYLLYPALGFVNLFEFHPVGFSVFFLLGAFEAFERKAFPPFLIFALLALSCQENVSLVIAMLGVYGFLRRRSFLFSIVPLGLGISWFVLSVLILMPRWNPGTINFSLLYDHLGRNPLEVFGFILTHPLKTLSLLFEGSERRLFVLQLLAPLAFIPLIDPKGFLLALPPFFEQLLSNRPMQHQIHFHYTTLLIPTLFYATLHGLRRLLSFRWMASHARSFHLLLIGLGLVMAVGVGPLGNLGEILQSSKRDRLDRKRDELVQRVPPHASVATTFEFLSHLTNRRHLYSLHRFYTGKNTLSRKPYSFPEDIDILLIDFNDPFTIFFMQHSPEPEKRMVQFLKGWKVREAFQDLVFLEKGEGPFLIHPLKELSPEKRLGITIEESFVLVGISGVTGEGGGEILPLTFFWECLRQPSKPYGLLFTFLNDDKKAVAQVYHPIGYRIYPPFLWKEGDRFKEAYALVFPSALQDKRTYELRLSIVDEATPKVVWFETDRVSTTNVSLGKVKGID